MGVMDRIANVFTAEQENEMEALGDLVDELAEAHFRAQESAMAYAHDARRAAWQKAEERSTRTDALTAKFHAAFGHPVRETPTVIPTAEEALLALRLIEEEFMELAAAFFPGHPALGVASVADMIQSAGSLDDCYEPDLVECADAIADLDVVVNGAGIRMGLPMKELAIEVADSNMSKLGEDGEPVYREDGKIAKGPNFRQPDIEAVLLGKM